VDRTAIEAIIRKAQVCRLGMADGGQPYVVPLCFGYEEGVLYFHTGAQGRKLEVLRRNSSVCFELEADVELVPADQPCRWAMKYRSVIGFGTAAFVNDSAEKRRALACIMRQYSDRSFEFPDDVVRSVTIVKVAVSAMTGRQAGY